MRRHGIATLLMALNLYAAADATEVAGEPFDFSVTNRLIYRQDGEYILDIPNVGVDGLNYSMKWTLDVNTLNWRFVATELEKCQDPIAQDIADKLVFSLEPHIAMRPGQTYRFRLFTRECCVYLEPVYGGCPKWSVTPNDKAMINKDTGFFAVDPSTPYGTVFTVTARVNTDDGHRQVSTNVHIYTFELNPLVGTWREVEQISCDSGERLIPEDPIREICFHADGTFSVTWHPFEVYEDYWGKYTYELDTPRAGRLELQVDGGNYVPADVKTTGTFSIAGSGELIMEDIWFGSRETATAPVACGHVLVQR